MKTPKALDAIADKVLRYRPKAKSKPAIQRKRRATEGQNRPAPFCKLEQLVYGVSYRKFAV